MDGASRPEPSAERGVRSTEPDQLEGASDHGALERLVDLRSRVVVAVDRPALPGPLDRRDDRSAREQADVVDLRDAPGEQLDRASSQVSVVVLTERRVVRAVELMDVDAVPLGVGQHPVDVAAPGQHDLGQVVHLGGLEDAHRGPGSPGCRRGSRAS